MSHLNQKTLPVSVITTCFGRNAHLYNLLSSLAAASAVPSEVIIVNDDSDKDVLASYPLTIKQIPTKSTATDGRFDIGCNRNLGAAAASNEAMIFLDVDCLVADDFIESLFERMTRHPTALLMGQPRYLTRPLSKIESRQLKQGKLAMATLNRLSILNPYRFNFTMQSYDQKDNDDKGIILTQDYGAFWSLCFGIYRDQFKQIGGFDTAYIGYGAEDTDFAFMAKKLGIAFYLTNDLVYHQQHSVHRPSINHLNSIVVNANRFYQKWQHWPMSGWLSEFAQLHLIEWSAAQSTAIKIQNTPSQADIEAAHQPDAPFI
ncbi:glycosyltransferase family 2 protein [Psychrobacter ciconiae]|uniref:glycosyltransferase family 2 protein n=1 Tax=Psychrobacter ciconiae TaxID=1553449 RepID=UPI001918CBDA|nr:glycosyltransferase [Psychrobacter ciconiae]